MVKKNTNNFSFIEEIFTKINNADFAKQAYIDYSNNQNTEYLNIFSSLSSIGGEITEKIYSEILNYIDNVSNIDLCKVKALLSMAKMLGVDYTFFNNIDYIPNDIIDIIDIMSINPVYLVNSEKINIDETLKKSILSINTETSTTYFNTNATISNCIYNLIKTNITSVLCSNYFNNELSNSNINLYNTGYLINNLSNNILLSGFCLTISENDEKEIKQLKSKHNIPISFDQETEANKIYDGISSLNNYTTNEQEILKFELSRRKQPWSTSDFTTKYFYYKERKFKQYYQFIEQYYYGININNTNILSDYIYNVDNNYMLLNYSNDKLFLHNKSIFNNKMIDNVVLFLTKNILYITTIRELLKSLVLKNFMKGTFVLIEHIIKEYLNQLILNDNNLSTINNNPTIKLIEYDDITKYYNISTDICADTNDNSLNQRFWEGDYKYRMIVPYDNNNMLSLPKTINCIVNNTFSEIDLSNFYFDMLNLTFKNELSVNGSIEKNSNKTIQKLSNLLSVVFDSGAEKIYLSSNYIIYNDLYGQQKEIELHNDVLDIFEQYKKNIFLQYSGNKKAYSPYYYIDNSKHPSYLIHQYIKHFIQHLSTTFPIQDIINFADYSISTNIIENIDAYIDNDGYLISAWNNPLNTNDEYISRYELKNNKNSLGVVDPKIGYTGLFYPDAIDQFVFYQDVFYKNLLANNELSYYYGLNLSLKDIQRIYNCLEKNRDIIVNVATQKFDIYKYSEDIYGNQYFLLKQINQNNNDNKTTKDNSGFLFIKQKNYPIAIPAIVLNAELSSYSFFELRITNYNTINFDNIEIYNMQINENIIIKMPAIYDFEIFAHDTLHIMLLTKTNLLDNYIDFSIKINRLYDYDISRFIFSLENIQDLMTRKCIDLHKYKHYKYINIDNSLNSIYFSLNKHTLNILIHKIIINSDYYNTHEEIKEYIPLKRSDLLIDDIVFDINNHGKGAIAYLYDINIKNYLRKNYLHDNYKNEYINNYDIFDNLIVVHNITFSDTIKIDNIRYYNSHTEMGFTPIIVQEAEEQFNNDISKTILLKERQVEKIQIFGKSNNSNIFNGIDFKFTAPIRSYSNNLSSYSQLNYLAFDDNTKYNKYIELNEMTDNRYVLNTTLCNYYLPLKSDEGYIEDNFATYTELVELSSKYVLIEDISNVNSAYTATNIAKFKLITEEFLSSNILLCSDIFNANISSCISCEKTKNIDIANSEINEISVLWYKNENGSIKLDFNAQYALLNPYVYDEISALVNVLYCTDGNTYADIFEYGIDKLYVFNDNFILSDGIQFNIDEMLTPLNKKLYSDKLCVEFKKGNTDISIKDIYAYIDVKKLANVDNYPVLKLIKELRCYIDNTRNNKHLFLNLDKPGDAGYLNIYQKHNYKYKSYNKLFYIITNNIFNYSIQVELLQRYYIKNISDKYPKFMISAELNYVNNNNDNILVEYDSNTNEPFALLFDQPNNLNEFIKVEV